MFRKLKNQFKLEYEKGRQQVFFGDVISYYDVDLVYGGVLSVIPLKYRNDFQVSLMEITGDVPPHTDSEIKTTINFYVDPGSYMTKFYRIKQDGFKTQIENQTNGFLFDPKDLQHCGTFIANAEDGWILDVTMPHSVQAIKGVTRRNVICLATDKHNYDQVCQMLFESGNL